LSPGARKRLPAPHPARFLQHGDDFGEKGGPNSGGMTEFTLRLTPSIVTTENVQNVICMFYELRSRHLAHHPARRYHYMRAVKVTPRLH
jgi:hypothetical protein